MGSQLLLGHCGSEPIREDGVGGGRCGGLSAHPGGWGALSTSRRMGRGDSEHIREDAGVGSEHIREYGGGARLLLSQCFRVLGTPNPRGGHGPMSVSGTSALSRICPGKGKTLQAWLGKACCQ